MEQLAPLLEHYRHHFESRLEAALPGADTPPQRLHEAMRYTCTNGGKRIRPLLVYLTGRALGLTAERLDAAACAVELIHAYSLVHDDLPAMDDDDLRRGQPTCHRAYDEATAILVGDALQTLAFEVLTAERPEAPPPAVRLQLVAELALASGSRGMAGGQALDIAAEGKTLTLAQLETIHRHKTGALIRAAVRMAALCAPELEHSTLQALSHYADCVGLAFQIRDDILDVIADSATLGKPQGSDAARNKMTYTALLGLDGARDKATELYHQALQSLGGLDERADPLRWLAHYTIERIN